MICKWLRNELGLLLCQIKGPKHPSIRAFSKAALTFGCSHSLDLPSALSPCAPVLYSLQ